MDDNFTAKKIGSLWVKRMRSDFEYAWARFPLSVICLASFAAYSLIHGIAIIETGTVVGIFYSESANLGIQFYQYLWLMGSSYCMFTIVGLAAESRGVFTKANCLALIVYAVYARYFLSDTLIVLTWQRVLFFVLATTISIAPWLLHNRDNSVFWEVYYHFLGKVLLYVFGSIGAIIASISLVYIEMPGIFALFTSLYILVGQKVLLCWFLWFWPIKILADISIQTNNISL